MDMTVVGAKFVLTASSRTSECPSSALRTTIVSERDSVATRDPDNTLSITQIQRPTRWAHGGYGVQRRDMP
jgi:hypothetical protein